MAVNPSTEEQTGLGVSGIGQLSNKLLKTWRLNEIQSISQAFSMT